MKRAAAIGTELRMTTLHETAYPRLKPDPTAKELQEIYTPTEAERLCVAERRRRFAPLLASFDRMYESIYAFRAGRGEHGLLSPEELAQWENKEWPDPRW